MVSVRGNGAPDVASNQCMRPGRNLARQAKLKVELDWSSELPTWIFLIVLRFESCGRKN